jgi:hypothetical protein
MKEGGHVTAHAERACGFLYGLQPQTSAETDEELEAA